MEAFKSFKYAQAPHFFYKDRKNLEKRGSRDGRKNPSVSSDVE